MTETVKRREPSDWAYLLHKLGTQVLSGSVKSFLVGLRAISEYQVYLSKYTLDNTDPIFNGSASFIYRPGNPVSSVLKQLTVPSELRNMTVEDAVRLRSDYAARFSQFQMQLFKTTNGIDFSMNFAALLYGIFGDEKLEVKQAVVFSLRMLTSGSYFVAGNVQAKAFKAVRSMAENPGSGANVYKQLNFARQISIAMNLVQTAGGLFKVGVEIERAINSPKEFNLSAMIDGSVNAGAGASWAVYNSYLAKTAAGYAKNPATINAAIDTLWVKSIPIPSRILWTARGLGMTGPAISGAISVKDIYSGFTDNALPRDLRERKIVSGSIGFLSSAAFAGSAYYLAGALTPVGSICLAVGLGLVAVGTVYENWDAVTGLASYAVDVVSDGIDCTADYVADEAVALYNNVGDGMDYISGSLTEGAYLVFAEIF